MNNYTIKFIYAQGGSAITSLLANNFISAAISGKGYAKEEKYAVAQMEVCDSKCNFFETYTL